MRGVLALASLALLALPGAAVVPGGYEGRDCQYVYAPFVADAGVARREVPAAYAMPVDALGYAVLFLTVARCDISVEGGPSQETYFSDAGVFVLPPGAGPGLHLYWLWHLSSNGELQRFLLDRGAPAMQPTTTGFGFGGDAVLTVTGGGFGWAGGAYQTTGLFAKASHHPGLDGIVSWWHDGPLGRVRLDQGFVGDEEEHGLFVVGNPAGLVADLVAPLEVEGLVATEGNLNFADLVARFA